MSASRVEPGAQGAEVIDRLKDKEGKAPAEIFHHAKDKIKKNADTTNISTKDPSIDDLATHKENQIEKGTSDIPSKPMGDLKPASEKIEPKKAAEKHDNDKTETPVKKVIPEPRALGWMEVGGFTEKDKIFPDDEVEDDLSSKLSHIEDYVPNKFYGDWYHNAGIIFASCLIAFIIAKIGGGFGWVFFPMIFSSVYYRTSVRKLRRLIRDGLIRECEKTHIETDVESMEWFNIFMTKFWVIFEPALSAQVVTEVNKVLRDACPNFLESLALETFTLGTKPFRIDHVRTFPKTEEDIAVMDWKVSFTPYDSIDFNSTQSKNMVDCKIILVATVGKGKFSLRLPVVVSNPTFAGFFRVRFRMMTTFPHIQTVDVSLLEHPKIDFNLKPIGGSFFGVDVNVIPGLSAFVNEIVSSVAGPMLYSPNSFHLNIQQMLAGGPLDSAIGVVAVTAQTARDLKGSEGLGSTMDPYVIFSLNRRVELDRTSVKLRTSEPKWNETKFILVKNLNEVLTMDVFDFNEFKKDKRVGGINFHLSVLEENHIHEGLTSKVLVGNKVKGEFNYDVRYFPILKGRTLDDGSQEPPTVTNSGIVRLTIHSAKDLSGGVCSPFAELEVNNKSIFKTEIIKNTAAPVWESSHEFLVTDRAKCKIATLVKNSNTGSTIGKHAIRLQDLLDRTEDYKDWFDLSSGGNIRITALWSSVALESFVGSSGYPEPIGTVRVHVKKALDLRNLETVGKVDPYVRVFVNGFQKGRTFALNNELNPVWDDIVYVPIHNERQRIIIEAMDVESGGKDRSLGSFEIFSNALIKKNEQGKYLEYKDAKDRTNLFKMSNKSPKGTLFYNLSFFPTVPIMDPEESAEKKKAEEEAAKRAEEKAAKKDEKEASAVTVNNKDNDGKEMPENKSEEKIGEDIVEVEKLDLSFDELISYDTGVFAFTVVQTEISETGVYVQILFDHYGHPAFTTPKLRSRKEIVGETGDILIRELDWSMVTIRLTEKSYSKDSGILGSVSIPTLSLLKKSYYQDHDIMIKTKNGGDARVRINSRYFPVQMELDLRESINNMGSLKVGIISAEGLAAADRSGSSDPYALVLLDGQKVFKTKTIKKTLSPTWNESFDVDISSRTSSKFLIKVFDWDMGPTDDDFLGQYLFDLKSLKPMEEEFNELKLTGPGSQGSIKVRTIFKPKYVVRGLKSRTAEGLPPGVSDIAGLGSMGAGAVADVGAKGSSILKGSILHLGKKHDDNDTENMSDDTVIDGNVIPLDSYPGNITVIGSVGFEGCHSLQVKVLIVARKEVEIMKTKPMKPIDGQCIWNEGAEFRAAPNDSIVIKVYDHKMFGSNLLDENTLSLSDIGSGEANMSFGNGELKLNMKYERPDKV